MKVNSMSQNGSTSLGGAQGGHAYSNSQGAWLGRYPRSGVSVASAFCASFLLLYAHYLPGALRFLVVTPQEYPIVLNGGQPNTNRRYGVPR